MSDHRNPRASVSNRPTPDNPATDCGCPDLDATLWVTTDSLGRADAFISAAERLIEDHGAGVERPGEDGEDGEYDDDHDPSRLRNNLAHLVESTKLAVRGAQYAHNQTVAMFEAHRAESERTAETTPVVEVQP